MDLTDRIPGREGPPALPARPPRIGVDDDIPCRPVFFLISPGIVLVVAAAANLYHHFQVESQTLRVVSPNVGFIQVQEEFQFKLI